MSAEDASAQSWHEGDLLRVSTPRGEVTARLRISGIRPGVLFLPFHYGYWDEPGGHQPEEHGRAANELTLTDWDPASKQPLFKTAAAQVELVRSADGEQSTAPTTTASRPIAGAHVAATVGGAAAQVHEDPDATEDAR
jgi:predicted molibdopterin-dependent oxidoreductase YjgC